MGQRFIGIDVAKDRLDVHVRPSGEAFAVARDGKGLDELVSRLRQPGVALIVLEATSRRRWRGRSVRPACRWRW